MLEDIQAMLEEDVGWAQESHHVEKSVPVQGRGENQTGSVGQGQGVEMLEPLQGQSCISAVERRREARPLNNLGAE